MPKPFNFSSLVSIYNLPELARETSESVNRHDKAPGPLYLPARGRQDASLV
jgi:hypothetical protein